MNLDDTQSAMRRDPAVTALLDANPLPFTPVIAQIRAFLLGADPLISETVKWNSPNFQFAGSDRVTLNSRPGKPLIVVLHLGTKTGKQAAELDSAEFPLEWKASDRAQITIPSPEAWPGLSNAACSTMLDWMIRNQG
jgi:hypothetical protein